MNAPPSSILAEGLVPDGRSDLVATDISKRTWDSAEAVTISADASQPIEQRFEIRKRIEAPEMRDRADFTLRPPSNRRSRDFECSKLGGFGPDGNR